MAMVQCTNGHLYDNGKHTNCPHCPIPGLRDAKVPGTQAASMDRPGMPTTEPAFPSRGAKPPVRPAGGYNRGGAANVTVGIFQKQGGGINPVVGWLVCIKGTNKGRDYRLHSDRNKIGRAPNMDICIEGDETISREDHCQIAFSPRSKTFNLIPGSGRNLIYLNDKDVFAATELAAYDKIDLGESSFMFIPFCGDRFQWDSTPRRHDPPTPEPSGDTQSKRRNDDTIVG